MATLFRFVIMVLLLGLFSGCAYDPAYPYNPSNGYYGGSGYGNNYNNYSGYGNGYRNGHYNTGSPRYGYNNRGYGNGRYCPDDDD